MNNRMQNCGVMMQKPFYRKQERGFTVWLSIVLLVIIGVMAAGGFYVWKQTQAQMEMLNTYVAKVETELGAKNDAVKEFKMSLAKIAADSESQDVVLDDHLRTLDDHLGTVDSRLAKLEISGSEWLLSEVEYLLKMAELRIGMKEDVKGAVRILQKAEELIKKMPKEDAGLMQVRVAISQDIASMQIYREVDVPGTFADLVTLGDTIEKLPIIPTKLTDHDDLLVEKNTETGADKKPAKDGPKILADINETFAGYLTIRKHNTDELKALLSPEQRLNFRDSMRLALEQAATGLLRGDQTIYDASMAKVRKWILDYFMADNFKVQMATKKVEELIKVQVKQDLPSVAESQQELRRYISDRMMDQ